MTVKETKVDKTFLKKMQEFRIPNKEVGLIEACSENVVIFSEYMLGVPLYAWQVKFLNTIQEEMVKPEGEREFVAITSRQIGKSKALSIFCLWACIFNKYPGTTSNNTSALIVSASDVQAKKLLYEMKKDMMMGSIYMKSKYNKDFGTEFFKELLSENEPNNTTTITFKPWDEAVHGVLLKGSKSGSTIKSYPPTSSVLGECQIGSDKVLLTDGSYVRIDEIEIGDSVVTSDHFSKSQSNVTNIKDNGIRQVLEFTTSRGNTVTVTKNHPLMTQRGWVEAFDILETDKLCQLTNFKNKEHRLDWGQEIPKFMGYMLGDGSCVKRNNLKFTQEDGVQKEEFTEICKILGIPVSWCKDKRSKNCFNAAVGVKAWDNILLDSGLAGKDAGTKTLPNGFNLWSTESKALLLNRYFSCDGWFMNRQTRPEIGLFSKSKTLISQVQSSLLEFNIRSNIRKRIKGEYVGYELGIRYNYGIQEFIKNIGILGKTDTPIIKDSMLYQHTTHDINDFEFVNIRNIELKGKQQTYGITIEDTHCYISNGILNHNTASIVIEDEAGKSDKITDQFHLDYLYPTGNSTNAIRIYTSTPWGPTGFFYRMVDPDNIYGETPAKIFLFTMDAIRLENDFQYKAVTKTIEQYNRDGKTDEVQRAYYCRFIKGESSYFDPKDIFDSFEDYAMLDKYEGKADMGVDFGGQVKSKTVITITEYTEDNKVRRLYHQSYPVGKDTDLIEDIANLRQLFNIQRIVVDDCPAGQVFIRQMEDEKGWEVERMSFRADKVKKYGAFRVFLKRGKIQSYQDEELKTEMLSMEHTPGSRQSNIQHAPGYSDDLIDSFLMSTYFFIEDEDSVTFFGWNDKYD
jgi:hypothetical protein